MTVREARLEMQRLALELEKREFDTVPIYIPQAFWEQWDALRKEFGRSHGPEKELL
jgi:hypothetical protein